MQIHKDVVELKKTALLYWPKELSVQEKDASVIPLLLETQDAFISILKFATARHDAWIDALKLNKNLYPNLFLKHLSVITDMGGESLKRYSTEFPNLFSGKSLTFPFNNELVEHEMTSLSAGPRWSNSSLSLDGKGLFVERELSPAIKDVAYMLMFGSIAMSPELPEDVKEKCVIGELLGNKDSLEQYVKQRYIWVSRQTGGARSNSLGYLIQHGLLAELTRQLPDWDFSEKSIEGIFERTMNDEQTLAKFDIVAKSPTGLCWGIESSFQFTTNSVIERKAGQAPGRRSALNAKGHKVAYAIDGAGNFERAAALQSIIESSDCTVNFSAGDVDRLVVEMKRSIEYAP
jgi:hypothetical protein